METLINLLGTNCLFAGVALVAFSYTDGYQRFYETINRLVWLIDEGEDNDKEVKSSSRFSLSLEWRVAIWVASFIIGDRALNDSGLATLLLDIVGNAVYLDRIVFYTVVLCYAGLILSFFTGPGLASLVDRTHRLGATGLCAILVLDTLITKEYSKKRRLKSASKTSSVQDSSPESAVATTTAESTTTTTH